MINLEDYLDEEQIEYFKDNLYLLKEDNYQKFYLGINKIKRGFFTKLFLACGINPLEYMTYVPDYFAYELNIESIDIPEGIEEIGECAFDSCSGLKAVKLPNSLQRIDFSAFSDCSSLEEIEIPESVKTIDAYSFYKCYSLKKVKILNEYVELIYTRAFPFFNCSKDMLVEVRSQKLAYIFKNEGFKNIKIF